MLPPLLPPTEGNLAISDPSPGDRGLGNADVPDGLLSERPPDAIVLAEPGLPSPVRLFSVDAASRCERDRCEAPDLSGVVA